MALSSLVIEMLVLAMQFSRIKATEQVSSFWHAQLLPSGSLLPQNWIVRPPPPHGPASPAQRHCASSSSWVVKRVVGCLLNRAQECYLLPIGPYLSLQADRRLKRLLRKEVIQPHLPVRLPCYDFVPIARLAFDGSLPCGLGHRLRALPTFVT